MSGGKVCAVAVPASSAAHAAAMRFFNIEFILTNYNIFGDATPPPLPRGFDYGLRRGKIFV